MPQQLNNPSEARIRELIEARHELRERLFVIEGSSARKTAEVRDVIAPIRDSFSWNVTTLEEALKNLEISANTGAVPDGPTVRFGPVQEFLIEHSLSLLSRAIVRRSARRKMPTVKARLDELTEQTKRSLKRLDGFEYESIPSNTVADPSSLEQALELQIEIASVERELNDMCDTGADEWHAPSAVVPPFLTNWAPIRKSSITTKAFSELERRIYACRVLTGWEDTFWALPNAVHDTAAINQFVDDTIRLSRSILSLKNTKEVRPLKESLSMENGAEPTL